MPPLFHCSGSCRVILPHGLVARQACLVLWLRERAFSSKD